MKTLVSNLLLATVLASTMPALPAAGEDLDSLLRPHYTARSSAKRRSLQREIVARPGLTPKKLAAAIRRLQLWDAQPAGEREITVRLRRGESSEMGVWIRVPQGYEPSRPWPLLITLHGQGGKAQPMLAMARRMLGDRVDDFLIASPQDIGPLGFTEPIHVVARPRDLLAGLRRIFRIDSNRVFLTGYSLGSQNTWMATVMHADQWAGVVPLATPLQLVGGALLYPEVLPNCRNTPILFCWGKRDTLMPNGDLHPQGGNAALARIMASVIDGLKFYSFEAVQITDADHFSVVAPPDQLRALLERKRLRFPKRIRQVYRLTEQSRAYWVESLKLQGKPLPDGQVNIPVKQGEDPVEAQAKWLTSKLGLIEAKRSKQTIHLTTRKTGSLALLLGESMIDLDKPVKIVRNKRQRFKGRIPRDLTVMLEESARGWDFHRLYSARVVIPLGGKTKFGYPERSKSSKRRK